MQRTPASTLITLLDEAGGQVTALAMEVSVPAPPSFDPSFRSTRTHARAGHSRTGTAPSTVDVRVP